MRKCHDGIIFYKDFTSLDLKELTFEEIEKKYCLQITRNPYFDDLPEGKKEELKKFVLYSIHLASSAHLEITFDIQEEYELLSVFLYAGIFVMTKQDLNDFCNLLNSSMDMFILPPPKNSKDMAISIGFNLSQTMPDRDFR